MICKISNFNIWTAKHLAQASLLSWLYVQKPCCNLSFSFNYLRDFPNCLELQSHFEYHFYIPSFQNSRNFGGPSLYLSLWRSNQTPFSGPPCFITMRWKSELIGMFRLRSVVRGIHKRLQQFWGGGSKISATCQRMKVKKQCRHEGGGGFKSEKVVDVFYGWSLWHFSPSPQLCYSHCSDVMCCTVFIYDYPGQGRQ